VAPSQAPAPALEATLPDLIARLNDQTAKIKTLTATVDLQLTEGSVYSGVIKDYHDVKGFVLLKKPAMIRILGQAPVVRTDIFDMVSDGREFRLSIPPKQKFIVGPTDFKRAPKKSLENLRPQHILDALLVPPIDLASQSVSFEEEEAADGHRYYVVTVLKAAEKGEFYPVRKIWFDRADLSIARLELFGPQGHSIEDVHYSRYQDFGDVSYPTDIRLRRPVEDYGLEITVQKASFNQPVPPEKFELKKPANAELVDLSDAGRPEDNHGK
jgi:outer membrane lipoprotein-sorting protein